MLKALGNPVRLQILTYLASTRGCITNDIVQQIPLAQSTISQHLKVLRQAGLILGEIEGPATCYCLSPQGLRWLRAAFLQTLDSLETQPEPQLIQLETRSEKP
jgi:ArsR family transcriptional regulator